MTAVEATLAYITLNRSNPEVFYMSLLHRNVLSQILSAIDPLIEVGAAIVNPLAGAGAKLVLTDVESIVSGTSAPAAAAAPAPAAPPSTPNTHSTPPEQPFAPAPAAAPLTAADVIAALMQTLQALQART